MKLFKEPLLHFLFIGAGLFVLNAWINPESDNDGKTIVVDSNRINQIKRQFRSTWRRSPTRAELESLVDNFVVEEILYRQALEMGLDKDDSMIRRRLRQKMEFITEDLVSVYRADDKQLQTYLEDNSRKFIRGALYSFDQIYVSTDKSADDLQLRIAAVTQQLDASIGAKGDNSLLPESFENTTEFELKRTFGGDFVDQLDQLPLDQWRGPLLSGLGVHFVRLHSRQPSYLPALPDIRDNVEQEWRNTKNQEIKADFMAQLKSTYDIHIVTVDDTLSEMNH